MPTRSQKTSRYYGRQFLRSHGFKTIVVTKLSRVKLVIDLWRFAAPEKSYCKKRPVYAIDRYIYLYSAYKSKRVTRRLALGGYMTPKRFIYTAFDAPNDRLRYRYYNSNL